MMPCHLPTPLLQEGGQDELQEGGEMGEGEEACMTM